MCSSRGASRAWGMTLSSVACPSAALRSTQVACLLTHRTRRLHSFTPVKLAKTILVPTDFSPRSRRALDYAVRLAGDLDAHLSLVHAAPLPEMMNWDGGWHIPYEFCALVEASARSQLDNTLSALRADDVSVTGQVVHGTPSGMIVQMAHSVRADLIVMGTEGRRFLARLLLGSVAESVMRSAPCPVLTVRS